MRQTATKILLTVVLSAAGFGLSSPVQANKLDLALAGFFDCTSPPVTGTANCTARVADFEQFMAEYAFGLAPKVLAPAETLGYSGFYMGLEGTLTPRPRGADAQDRWDRGTASDEWPDVMFNPGIHIRKGLPWSLEIGGTISYLAQSELVSLGGQVKWAPFEGYRNSWRGFLPDIAVRGAIERVLGEGDVDMSVVAVDASLSYAFGIGGMVTLTPYAGYQFIWTIVNVEPLLYKEPDDTFHQSVNDHWKTDGLSNPTLTRNKMFFGLRFGYELLVITLELDWGLPHKWETDVAAIETEIGHQIQISGGVGMDF